MFRFGSGKRGRHEINMTEGPLLPKILAFSGPLILTGILQLLYNAADVIVVGNYAGHEALAAVSSTGSLINLLVNVFMGLSVGASVVIARNYGARELPTGRTSSTPRSAFCSMYQPMKSRGALEASDPE